MNLSDMDFEEVRQHAISVTTLAAVVMSQVEGVSQYAPVAAAVAFLFAATGYTSFLKAAEEVVDALEDADVIDDDVADVVEDIIDIIDDIIDDESDNS